MSHETALIIIDSGFSQQAIDRARRVIAINDLPSGRVVIGNPTVSAEDLAEFAGDTLHHGTIVLERLMDRVPDMPVILVRALGERGSSFMRTSWNDDGTIAEQGWTEGYRWAVDLCRKLGMRSVANCSFGAFIHASDGTGWEAHQVSQETGPGKPNHIMVVAAGPGDGRAQHASWRQLSGETIPVTVQQRDDAKYNLWSAAEKDALWQLAVYLNGEEQFTIDSRNVPRNLWNQRKQQTFTVRGEGRVDLVMHVDSTGTASERRSAFCTCGAECTSGCPTDDGVNEGALRFDVWAPSDSSASFLSRIDLTLISEPAIFSETIAVGLRRGVYAENQTQVGVKPEVLLPGGEQISFRIPEVVAEIARMLRDSAEDLDVVAVRNRLGKYPKLS